MPGAATLIVFSIILTIAMARPQHCEEAEAYRRSPEANRFELMAIVRE